MKSEKDWPALSFSELEEEMDIRRALHGDMVGTLYPGILLGEISRLGLLRAAKRETGGR